MRLTRFLAALLAAGTLFYLLRWVLLPPVATWLNVSDPQLPVDYVIPLPGGNDDRPFAAAALIRTGLASRVGVVVNDRTPDVEDGIVSAMHEVTRRVLLRRSVSAEAIVMLKGTSASTFSDIQVVSQLFEQQPNVTIALVTSPSHTRRVRWTVDHVLPQYCEQVCVIAAYNDSYDSRIWWQSQQGLHAILSEHIKLIFYVLAYRSSRQNVLGIAIILAVLIVLAKLVRKARGAQTLSPGRSTT